ncbi:MAG TPA: competence/damage-inducible protein A [Cyclobacteriaceae bacterium]|nr:competence/damage-inducible protein A [Cyclobacteriaceae bacterium]
MIIKAEILAIGDELLYGQIVDTNSHWISQELDKIGVKVVQRTTVGDNRDAILKAFEAAERRADIVLITGGLGPTNDDLTKPLLAEYFGCSIELFPEALDDVRMFFATRGRELTPINALQAHLPTKCTYVRNEVGTAPGMWFDVRGVVWMSMPGVPHEMKKLMIDYVLPTLKKRFELPVIYHKVIKTVGIGESWLASRIAEWESNLPDHIKLAYLPSLGEVKLRLTAIGKEESRLVVEVEEQLEKLRPLIDEYIYGYDAERLPEAIGKLLLSKNKTVALAESCSGGYISHLITSIAGCSAYYNGGVVPYHNRFKIAQLGVKDDTLAAVGAVSEETVTEMARNVREKFDADYGLATSGIAGPTGGSTDKPVGTVWLACDYQGQTVTQKLQLTQERELNIQYTAVYALNLLRRCIIERD